MVENLPAQGLTLAWVWLLLLLPLPWLVRRWLSAAPRAGMQALKVPWFALMTSSGSGWMKKPVLAALAGLAWSLLILAAARPQWVGEIETLPVSGRDLLLAVDITGLLKLFGGKQQDRSVTELLHQFVVIIQFALQGEAKRLNILFAFPRGGLLTTVA